MARIFFYLVIFTFVIPVYGNDKQPKCTGDLLKFIFNEAMIGFDFPKTRAVPIKIKNGKARFQFKKVDKKELWGLMGFENGDILLELNGQEFQSTKDSNNILTEISKKREFCITFERAGSLKKKRLKAKHISAKEYKEYLKKWGKFDAKNKSE